jgi:hypothetical protein
MEVITPYTNDDESAYGFRCSCGQDSELIFGVQSLAAQAHVHGFVSHDHRFEVDWQPLLTATDPSRS